ncbi:hypothetical protein HDU97_003982 [Phlyctochytrium planicorne]|nr:hypothetical protein HDU97_003982 [Phlyctochytrium planicorne]
MLFGMEVAADLWSPLSQSILAFVLGTFITIAAWMVYEWIKPSRPSSSRSAHKKSAFRSKNRSKQNRPTSLTKPVHDDLFSFIPSRMLGSSKDEQTDFTRMGMDYFRIFFGPASGPRCFATVGFEAHMKDLVARGLISSPKWLVGASTSALRFMALLSSLANGKDVTSELKEMYCEMYYKTGDTPQVLRPMMEKCYRICAPEDALEKALSNPMFKIAILVANISPRYRNLSDWQLKSILVYYGLKNLVSPKYLSGLVSRICFYSGDEVPYFLANGLGGPNSIQFVKLTQKNVYAVLHATTCIPFIQERCTFIPDFGEGLFVDGALTDYTLNVQLQDPEYPALLLGDCLQREFSPTVFDTKVPWRTPPKTFFDHCSLVHPTTAFAKRIPDGALPSVGDWFKPQYIKDPTRRHQNWRMTYDTSQKEWTQTFKSIQTRVKSGGIKYSDDTQNSMFGKVVQLHSEAMKNILDLFA